MEAYRREHFREQLLKRRRDLEAAQSEQREISQIEQLLQEVDSALKRLADGTYGLCETCHEAVEEDRLRANPLVRFCLDHLTPQQRQSLEEDLDLAARIQKGLLPRTDLHVPGWQFRYHYEAAGPVSGDYLDFIAPDHGSVFFLLGDVSGKGIAASMLMAHLNALFRSLVSTDLPTAELMKRANRIFCDSTLAAHYATLVIVRAEGSGKVEICNAGHPAPLLMGKGGITEFQATGLPLGVFCESEYSCAGFTMAAGDSLMLYTDGLTEARNPAGQEYGPERLARLVGANPRLAPAARLSSCLDDLTAFRSGAQRSDDLSILVIGREG